jgi:hypothetical protein
VTQSSRQGPLRLTLEPAQLLRLYGLALGVGLLLEGGLFLLVNVLPGGSPALPFMTSDARHNLLHVVWGIVFLGVLLASPSPRRATLLMLVFGVFYTALGFAGVLYQNPFDLLLGPGENAFHFTVGLLALALSAWSMSQAPLARADRSSAKTSR